jgi:hypothetical protein
MAETRSRVICVGEVMVELSRGTEARYGLSFGGDSETQKHRKPQ